MNKNKTTGLTLVALTSVVTAVLPLTSSAEDKVLIQAQHYGENDERIKVNDGKIILEHDFGTDHTLNLEYNWDSISGASPTWDSVSGASNTATSDAVSGASPCIDEDNNYYQQCRDTRKIDGIIGDGSTDINDFTYKNVPLTDFRQSLSALYTYRTKEYRNELNLGVNYSAEDDFKNTGISAEYLINTDKSRNRSVTVGASYMKNEVYDYLEDKWHNFNLSNVQIGITQVFSPTLIGKVSLYGMRETGHLSNPYFNIIRKINVNITPEEAPYFKYYLARDLRPNKREAGGISAQVSKSINKDNAMQMSYRFYQDTWSVNSHTLDIKTYHHIGSKFRINPALRYYHQGEANFFKAHDGQDNYFDEQGYASADHRLGAYHSWTLQLGFEYLQSNKLTWNFYSGHQTQSSGLKMSWFNFGAQYKY